MMIKAGTLNRLFTVYETQRRSTDALRALIICSMSNVVIFLLSSKVRLLLFPSTRPNAAFKWCLIQAYISALLVLKYHQMEHLVLQLV